MVSAFTCVGWKVTLCDPIWQVTLRSYDSSINSYTEPLIVTVGLYYSDYRSMLQYMLAPQYILSTVNPSQRPVLDLPTPEG